MLYSKFFIIALLVFMLFIVIALLSLFIHLLLGIFANEVPFVASRREAVKAVASIEALYAYPEVWDIGSGGGDIVLGVATHICKNSKLKRKKIKVIGVEKYLTPFVLAKLRYIFSGRCVRKHVKFKLKDAFKLRSIPSKACFFFYMLPAFLERFYTVLEKKGFPECIVSCAFELPEVYDNHYKLVATKEFTEDSLFGTQNKHIFIYKKQQG